MLYPRENEVREVKDLSGIWNFKVDRNNAGFIDKWHARPLEDTILMPVPASYNDIVQDIAIRDHIGDVWYERTFFVPCSASDKRLVLRIGSASHSASVWVNGIKAVEHKGGFLPFEAEITDYVKYGEENRVTIAVNNILDWTTLPPGQINTYESGRYPEGYRTQEYQHDFYNYSGIHRPVKLYTTPRTYISDITVTTGIDGKNGIINYETVVENGAPRVQASITDEEGREVTKCIGGKGKLTIPEARLWEPGNAYLYTLTFRTYADDGRPEDCYRLPVGIRTIKVTEKEFLINGKPFYFKGFGRHEDSDIRGKGMDNVINIKDFNLLRWIGANSFRTTHYPYSEEIMDLADREGIAIIDEVPAVGMHYFDEREKVFGKDRVNEKTRKHHLEVMRELIQRDKNRTCVVMWSVANEAATYEAEAEPYFKPVVDEVRKLDPNRPVTIVHANPSDTLNSTVSQYFDVVCVNEYYGWYLYTSHLEVVEHLLENDLKEVYNKLKRPVLITEFGAEAIAGLHQDPPVMFTEEYQCEMLQRHCNVFDRLDFVIGEHVWNFADFATKQEISRVIGNKKGVFTRQRNPKAAAHMLRKRWSGEFGKIDVKRRVL